MSKVVPAFYDTISSGRLLVMLGVLWFVSIWSSIFYMSPGTDDAHFILEALGFITHGDIGFIYLDTFHEFFLTLPPYAFLNGLFYLTWDGIGLPINYYTYKIFHLLTLSFLITVSAGFTYFHPAANRKVRVARASLMLLFLATTPFALDIFNPRPEALGLGTTVLALMFFARSNGTLGAVAWGYPAAGFCLGVAAAAHPSFIVTSSGLALSALVFAFRNGAAKSAVTAIVVGFLPVLAVVVWYIAHLPLSVETLLANVGGRSPNASSFGVAALTVVDYVLLRLPLDASYSVRLYWGLPFWVFSLLLLACFVTLIGDLRRQAVGPIAQLHQLHWTFLLMSLVNALMAPSGRVQVYVVVSFAAALLIASRYFDRYDESEHSKAMG